MVAHHSLNVANRRLAVGLHIEGHYFGIFFAVEIRQIFLHSVFKSIEKRPSSSIATAQSAEVSGVVGSGKVEFFVFAIEVSHFTRKRNNIFRIEAVGFVF